VFASLASQPGDVILSRVNKDRSDKPVLATMTDTVKDLGIKGLFKGTVSWDCWDVGCWHLIGVECDMLVD
jgi:hypothetical protein